MHFRPPSSRFCFAATLLAAASLFGAAATVRAQEQAPVPAVDSSNRAAVINLYHNYYQPSQGLDPGFTGNVSTGVAGTLSQAYREATVRRINYYRAMCGLSSNIPFGATEDKKCQEAALMMAAQNNISHNPPTTWKFYTPDAAEACMNSNLRLDSAADEGPGAVDDFIADSESNNYAVGHRRWFLYAAQEEMGSGAVPPSDASNGVACIWIMNLLGTRPAGGPVQTSWPPKGFVPADLLYPRWSFSYLDADFSGTTVTVSKADVPLPVTQEALVAESSGPGTEYLGDNTIVWELPTNTVALGADETYTVHLANVVINGVAQAFDYTVTSIDASFDHVSMTALVPVAHRTDLAKGKIKLMRDGDVSLPQAIAYQVTGTGVADEDYAALSGSVTFKAGKAVAKIKVTPVVTPGRRGKKTVIVTLVPNDNYAASGPSTATVTVRK